jgi:hypothetical protein
MKFSGSNLVRVLVGQRRSGKSYILRQLVKNMVESGVPEYNTLYINKEFIEFDFISRYNELAEFVEIYRTAKNIEGKLYLFLDEVQQIEGWERAVDSFAQNFAESYECYITGSNSELLSGELASLLSGRYVSFEVSPFSYKEYCDFHSLEQNRSSFLEYLQSGALPDLFHLEDMESKRLYMGAVKDTILLRDIIHRYNIKDARLLEDIFAYLVNNVSNLTSVGNLVNYFTSRNRRVNYETIAHYTHYLETAFLIHRSERFNIKGKEVISGNCKYYMNDLSFRNYLYSGYGYGLGYLLENAVYLWLRQEGFEVYTGALRSGEVDFVAVKGDRTIYFQVSVTIADQQVYEREFGAFKSIDDNYEKYLVTIDEVRFPSYKGIKHFRAWELGEI